MIATIITFPADRITPPGEPCEARIIPFTPPCPLELPRSLPGVPGDFGPTALRRSVHDLVQRLAAAPGRDPMSINVEILRAGFPRRAACTPADLRNIRDYLLAATRPGVATATEEIAQGRSPNSLKIRRHGAASPGCASCDAGPGVVCIPSM